MPPKINSKPRHAINAASNRSASRPLTNDASAVDRGKTARTKPGITADAPSTFCKYRRAQKPTGHGIILQRTRAATAPASTLRLNIAISISGFFVRNSIQTKIGNPTSATTKQPATKDEVQPALGAKVRPSNKAG